MSLITRILPDNPVLTKELRVRMRGTRAYWILFGYLGFLTFVLLSAYYVWLRRVNTLGVGASESSRFGATLFQWVTITQIFLVLFITPAITSGSITLEREQRTLDMLTMTRMPRRSIILGKLFSSVSFTSLLLISSLPLVSICFMLGSVDPAMVFSAYLMMLFGSFMIGAMGLMWSSIAKTTTMAVMYTYGTLFVTVVAGYILIAAGESANGSIFSNVIQSVGAPLFGGVFLGVHGPDGTGFSVVCTLAGILMSAVAMARLEMFPERKARLLRGLTLLLVGVLALAADTWWISLWYHRTAQTVQLQTQPPIASLIVAIVLLMVLIPAFTTGELKPYEARHFGNYLLRGWTRKGLSQGKMASGLPFMLIATTLFLTIYALSFVLTGRTGSILRSATIGAPAPVAAPDNGMPVIVNGRLVQGTLPPGATLLNGRVVRAPALTQQNQPPAGYPQLAGDFLQAVLMLLAFTLGFSLLCMFASIALRNRWVAWFLCNLFLLLVLIGPERARQPVYDGMEPGSFINLYYLNPIQSLYQMGDPNGFWIHNNMLAIGRKPVWLFVTEGWLLVGGLSLVLMLPCIARERKINAEIPYEELAAEA